jgi:hypothetical protein
MTDTYNYYTQIASAAAAGGIQAPFAAPNGYHWESGGVGPNGLPIPVLVGNTQQISGSVLPGIPPSIGSNVPNLQTMIAPHQVITFDTIGQTIYSTLGHCRLPFRYIWVQGLDAFGDVLTSDSLTFAAALCEPIDPLEDGESFSIFEGAQQVFNLVDGITPPVNWDPLRQALLLAALATAVIYPGTEGQDPDPTITADKGADVVSANRGLRYIVIQDYPSIGLPALSLVWQRTNDNSGGGSGKKPKPSSGGAVEFLPGSS